MASAELRAAYRSVQRLAREHDRSCELKALLPLADPARELPLSSPSAPPLASVYSHWARSLSSSSSDAHSALSASSRLLSANLSLASASSPNAGLSSDSDSPHPQSPNHSYYQRRLERARIALTSAALPDVDSPSITLSPFEVLKEMERLNLKPIPRGFFISAIQTPAASERSDIVPASFEDSLRCFWMLELSTPLKPCSSIASALVAGALATVGSKRAGRHIDPALSPQDAFKWRAVHIHNALSRAGATVDRKTSNTLLRMAADLSRDKESGSAVASLLLQVRSNGVAVLEPALQRLLYASQKAESHELARAVLQTSSNHGYSMPPELVHQLSDWLAQSSDKNDRENADRLHNELRSSGKLAWIERKGSGNRF